MCFAQSITFHHHKNNRKGATHIAIYHLSIKIISRGKGKSAVAAAAYRAGEKITNQYDGEIHDYTRKGGVAHTEIMLPGHAPPEYSDRATLWNAVEKIEKNKNAQLSREIEIALPVELSAGQNLSLVRDYCQRHFVSVGMCADICIHDKKDGNPHAHIMLTMRPMEQGGAWGAKAHKVDGVKIPAIDWNEHTKAEEWRQGWAALCNQYLEQGNHAERIDHRSYERQGVEKIPTVHLGVAASQMERRGIATERGEHNRSVEVTNTELRQLRARIKKLKNWLYAQPLENGPTLTDMMKGISSGENLKSRWKKIADLKTAAKVLTFLQANGITDVEQLAGKVKEIHERIYEVSKNIKDNERRQGVVAGHLAHYENYKQHKGIYEKYRQLDPKKRPAFYEKHEQEIQLYQAAKQHFDDCMNGRKTLPIAEWKEEAATLAADRYALFEEYYQLKEDTRSIEVLRRGADTIMREDVQERSRTQAQEMDL